MVVNDKLKFRVDCNAGNDGQLCSVTDKLVVSIGQPILREGHAEIWDSLVVHCAREIGFFTVRVTICDPAWDEPREIVVIRSRPEVQDALTFELAP